MKLSTLLKGVKTRDVYEEREVERVTDRIEEVTENSVFVCIDGNRCDGHSFAENAVKKGAVAVITDRDLGVPGQVLTEDTRSALAIMASNLYGNPSKSLKLIGITGTNGKTSTSFFIKGVLEKLGHKCGIIGTVKNSYGNTQEESVLTTPEPIELHKIFRKMADECCEYCVMEVSSQALCQKRVYGLDFCACAITNITPEHLDYHGTMENYISSKLILCGQSDAVCINYDDENIQKNIAGVPCRIISYSALSDRADYTAKNILCNEKGIRYELVGRDCIERINMGIPAGFTVYNSLCAVSVLLSLGFDSGPVCEALSGLESVRGRAETLHFPGDITVMFDYAHTSDGLECVLKSVREFVRGRVITVFGCGGDRDKSKRAEMGRIAGEYSHLAVVTTDNPRKENPLLIINDILCGMEKTRARLAVIENRRQAIEFALEKARAGDLVLLAGKGHEEYQIVGEDKIPFDERQIVKNYFYNTGAYNESDRK